RHGTRDTRKIQGAARKIFRRNSRCAGMLARQCRVCRRYAIIMLSSRTLIPQCYGFVEKIEPLAIIARRFIFRISRTHSAKSSGCSTLSGLPSVSPPWMDISEAMVLGVSVITRMFSLRHSAIMDCERDITAALDAAYADMFVPPLSPAVEATFTMSPAPASFI